MNNSEIILRDKKELEKNLNHIKVALKDIDDFSVELDQKPTLKTWFIFICKKNGSAENRLDRELRECLIKHLYPENKYPKIPRNTDDPTACCVTRWTICLFSDDLTPFFEAIYEYKNNKLK